MKRSPERRPRTSRKFVGPPRPTLLQRVEQAIASSRDTGFSLGRWLASLSATELQLIEDSARRHRDDFGSSLHVDKIVQVEMIALHIQNAEDVLRFDGRGCTTRAFWTGKIVLETLVQAERMRRQGLLVIRGDLSMREDAQPTLSLTAEGIEQRVDLPDLPAAHAWRTWRGDKRNPDAASKTLPAPRSTCPTCGQVVASRSSISATGAQA